MEERQTLAEQKEGYFVRDLETDTVICPTGQLLYKKCVKSNGYTRYVRKAACSRCKALERCYGGRGKWKEIDFAAGAKYVKCRNWFRNADGLCKEGQTDCRDE